MCGACFSNAIPCTLLCFCFCDLPVPVSICYGCVFVFCSSFGACKTFVCMILYFVRLLYRCWIMYLFVILNKNTRSLINMVSGMRNITAIFLRDPAQLVTEKLDQCGNPDTRVVLRLFDFCNLLNNICSCGSAAVWSLFVFWNLLVFWNASHEWFIALVCALI